MFRLVCLFADQKSKGMVVDEREDWEEGKEEFASPFDQVGCWMRLIEFSVGLTASFDIVKYLFRLGWVYRNAVSLPVSHVPKSVRHTTNKEGKHLQSSVLILCDNREPF